MKVFKFGGASVKDAAGVKNVAAILQNHPQQSLIVVVSAMGKTTNALEKILSLALASQSFQTEITHLKEYHFQIMQDLFPKTHPVWQEVEDIFKIIEAQLRKKMRADQLYDQVVSQGEMISTIIVHRFIAEASIDAEWIDAREYIATNDDWREAKVDWKKTRSQMDFIRLKLERHAVLLTQGFIGRTAEGLTTTLGRDGSDYTAGIFGSILQAESVTIWKDVPGVMNADPKKVPDAATVFSELPFREAAEMTYYGASVIHPKTIKPLANKGIPLFVKNFYDPSLPGTKIHECKIDKLPPLIVFKENQCLVSCKVTDYTFVTEDQMSKILNTLAALNIRINVMQNSAISFSFCVDFREDKLGELIRQLHDHFEVYYNTGLTLITVKNYDEASFQKYRTLPGVLLEQSSRSTLQVLVKN